MDDVQLARLYAQYGYLVHRRCLQLVRRPEDAEDALQETFLRVKRYDGPREGGSVLAWLYTIAQICWSGAGESPPSKRGSSRPWRSAARAHPKMPTAGRCSAWRCGSSTARRAPSA